MRGHLRAGARLIGRPKNARLVGRVLNQAERFHNDYPCHRVVDHSGRLVPNWDAQAALLARAGVTRATSSTWTCGGTGGSANK